MQWVEYCNSPAGSTTLAEARRAAGFPQPFNVNYWGVGNESWGCGGNFEPAEYAMEFRRYATWVPGYGRELGFVASGPSDFNYDWTAGFFEAMAKQDPHFRVPALNPYDYVAALLRLRHGPGRAARRQKRTSGENNAS